MEPGDEVRPAGPGEGLRPRHGSAAGIELHELQGVPGPFTGATVTCTDFCPDQVRVERVEDIADFLARHRPEWSAVRWIDVEGRGDLRVVRALAEKYELHPLAVEDVVHGGQRPKAEDYPASGEHPGRLFVVAQAVEEDQGRLVAEQVDLFLGRKTLLTFRERSSGIFTPILQRVRSPASRLRGGDASFLLYALLDAIVDQAFPVLEGISDRLEALEEVVFGDGGRQDVPQQVHRLQRDLSLLRRVVWPMRELIDDLHREHHQCLSATTATYLRDVYDHAVRILELLEMYRELANSLVEMHMVAVSNRLNDIVRTLTVISTIFVPLTFLAGVYGMNMPIPENHYAWTYPLFWLVSAGVAGGLLYWFRRRGWF